MTKELSKLANSFEECKKNPEINLAYINKILGKEIQIKEDMVFMLISLPDPQDMVLNQKRNNTNG